MMPEKKYDTITANDHSVPDYYGGICQSKNRNLNVYFGGIEYEKLE